MTTLPQKALFLLQSGRNLPHRILNKVDSWVDRLSEPSVLGNVRGENELRQGLSQIAFPVDHLAEEPLLAFESELSVRLEKLAGYQAPFGTFHNGTATLGRLCYVACRALRPLAVVETGVAYGVTSAYILKALGENGTGELHSIDLPPLGREAEKYVGYLVPQNLRNRWNLRIGPARKLLPKVFREIGGADIFVHDSLHTYAQMNMEFATAMTALRPGGVLIADDVEGNRAFEEAVLDPRVASWFAIREKNKDAICGAMRMKCP